MSSVFLAYPFGNLVFGLENGGNLDTFNSYYKLMMTKANELRITQHVSLSLAGDFAKKFLQQGNVLGKTAYILTRGYQSSDQAFWINKKNYRAFIQKIGNRIDLIDVRNYALKNEEDFAVVPNVNPMLQIQEPAVIDSMRISSQKRFLCNCSESLHVVRKGSMLELFSGNIKIAEFAEDSFSINVGKIQTYVFHRPFLLSIPFVLYLLYAGYFLILLKKISFKNALLEVSFLLLPLLLALSYMTYQSVFLFDKKELVLFYLAPMLRFLSIEQMLIFFKMSPFIVLLLFHYFFTKVKKILYWVYYSGIIVLYAHVWYFPLNASSSRYIFILFLGMTMLAVLGLIIFWAKVASMKKRSIAIGGCIGFLFVITIAIFVSRTSYAVTTFEMQVLQKIKDEKKNIVFVNQADYSLVPIYRSDVPLIYAYPSLGQKLTGVQWQKVVRPESQVLKLTTNYDEKLIVIPRYLRTDLSEYEIRTLNVKLIFDNAQIALYEKR